MPALGADELADAHCRAFLPEQTGQITLPQPSQQKPLSASIRGMLGHSAKGGHIMPLGRGNGRRFFWKPHTEHLKPFLEPLKSPMSQPPALDLGARTQRFEGDLGGQPNRVALFFRSNFAELWNAGRSSLPATFRA